LQSIKNYNSIFVGGGGFCFHTVMVIHSVLAHYQRTPWSWGCYLCSFSRTSQHYMDHERSLPCLQEPSTGPNLEIHLNIIHTHLCLGLASGFFPFGFSTNVIYASLSPIHTAACPADLVLFDFVILIILYKECKF
jgi:hypothetical protein